MATPTALPRWMAGCLALSLITAQLTLHDPMAFIGQKWAVKCRQSRHLCCHLSSYVRSFCARFVSELSNGSVFCWDLLSPNLTTCLFYLFLVV
ncbi:hypothetical protein B0T09DRAFT_333328 [Sordaria sp. MPI-SDFR-AT-0083]|nr:hypothetical protein B0T09DRAFT_333328 [Sordaria sp. MPI-SDFR-AT-0083]